ncbi:hypothetical protein TruAng_004453 [Truncatella angustata]|nr:hypothetical protein TruAng_004453 [Truncatella angustata]
MRPHTPTINTLRTGVNVTSPPETPTTGSPTFNRRSGAGANARKETRGAPPRSSSPPPLGGVGSQFTEFTQFNRFNIFIGLKQEEISPRSSHSSDDDSSDDGSEASGSPPVSPRSGAPGNQARATQVLSAQTVVQAAFEIEECSSSDEDEDAMDSDGSDDSDDDDGVLRPDSIEYPASDSSRSASRSEGEVDPQLIDSLDNLNTTMSSDEEEDSDVEGDYAEYLRELKRARQQRRSRRMTQGSISKRTISERGSDSDREDLQPWDTGDINQRRLRRKVHNRHSLLSIPPDIIIELKEPNSDGEVVWDEHEINLARELPFWTMEVDSE